jgi:formylglycine-generating enzyme required for sulfatase activity
METSENISMEKNQTEFVNVKGAIYTMGTPKVPGQKYIPHKVELSSFRISKHLVTLKQYKAFLDDYLSDTVKSGIGRGKPLLEKQKGFKKITNIWEIKDGYDDFPVAVTWYGADKYCKHYGFRLPTEVEWEYAAKGGTLHKGFVYSGSSNLDDVAWHKDSAAFKEHFPVGKKMPNELGIYDMTGLMTEWCSDWYDKYYYSESQTINPSGPESGKEKVRRGGSTNFIFPKTFHINSSRLFFSPKTFINDAGFRPVMNISTDETKIYFKDSENNGDDSANDKIPQVVIDKTANSDTSSMTPGKIIAIIIAIVSGLISIIIALNE